MSVACVIDFHFTELELGAHHFFHEDFAVGYRAKKRGGGMQEGAPIVWKNTTVKIYRIQTSKCFPTGLVITILLKKRNLFKNIEI